MPPQLCLAELLVTHDDTKPSHFPHRHAIGHHHLTGRHAYGQPHDSQTSWFIRCGVAMPWGEWMVPVLQEHEDLDLRRGELGLLEQVHQHPEEVARLAGQLLRQNAMNHRIVQQAAARIIELEAREAAIAREASMRGRLAPRPRWAFRWPW